MRQSTEIMIQLIKSEVCRNNVEPLDNSLLDTKTLIDILILSRKHGVAQIVAAALIKKGILNESPQESMFLNELYSSIYLYEKTESVFKNVCSVFERNKICYIPLKGCVIRNLYPEMWMRSSCDIDILVKKADINKAVEILTKDCSFTLKMKTKHDIALVSPEGIQFELHFNLFGNKRSALYSKQLKNVWKYSEPVSPDRYEYRMVDNYFYYYHILHMAKHFVIGGCGLRPFLDLWLINNSGRYKLSDAESLLKSGKISEFEKYTRTLSEVWFSGLQHNETTLAMQKYIIEGGKFGSEKTRIIADNQRYNNKFKYLLSRIFVSKDYLQAEYPVVKKCPLLYPLFIVVRLFSFVFGRKKNFADRQMTKINQVNNDIEKEINLFKTLGI